MGSGLGSAWAIEKKWTVERIEEKGSLCFPVVPEIFFGYYHFEVLALVVALATERPESIRRPEICEKVL